MKLAISDGKEQQEAEVFNKDGHTIVMLGSQTFEFEFPDVEAEIVAFTEDGPLLLLEDELELLANYRGEVIQLVGNPYRDAIGQFASSSGVGGKLKAVGGSKAAGFAKQTGGRVGKAAISGAIGGAVTGGIGGAVKGVFKGNEQGVKEGSVLSRAKKGLIQGAISGAKRGAIKAVIRESFGIGSELAGNYGWAVKSVGGLSMSIASRKMNFGLNEKDLSGISREMFAGGFADLAQRLDYDGEIIVLDESKFSRGLAELAYAIADALEESPDTEGIGFENTPELGSLGFKEENGIWYIEREQAEELLAGLSAYAEVKLEDTGEIIKLANPWHDNLGRFATAQNLHTAAKVAGQIGKAAGVGRFIISSIHNTRVNQVYKKEGGPETDVLDYFSSKGRARIGQAKTKRAEIVDRIKDEKIFSKMIGGKEVSVKYGQLNRTGKILGAVSMSANVAGGLLWLGGTYKDYATGGYQPYKTRKERYNEERQQARDQAQREWEERERRGPQAKSTSHWPPAATEKDFQKMYRKVAQKYHPDIGGSIEQMQKINQAYANKDWFTINELYTQLEAYLLENEAEFTTEQAETLGLLIRILKQALDDGAEYIIFPADEDEHEPFVVIDGEMVLDRPTAELIVDAFMGDEDERTDRPVPSEG